MTNIFSLRGFDSKTSPTVHALQSLTSDTLLEKKYTYIPEQLGQNMVWFQSLVLPRKKIKTKTLLMSPPDGEKKIEKNSF